MNLRETDILPSGMNGTGAEDANDKKVKNFKGSPKRSLIFYVVWNKELGKAESSPKARRPGKSQGRQRPSNAKSP